MQPRGLSDLHICFFDEPLNVLLAFLHANRDTGAEKNRTPMAVTHVVKDFLYTYIQTFVEFAGNFNERHHGLSNFDLV